MGLSYLLIAHLMCRVIADIVWQTQAEGVPYQSRETLSAFLFNPQFYEVWVTRSNPNIPFVVTILLIFRCWKIYLTLSLCVGIRYVLCCRLLYMEIEMILNYIIFHVWHTKCVVYGIVHIHYAKHTASSHDDWLMSRQSSQYTQ